MGHQLTRHNQAMTKRAPKWLPKQQAEDAAHAANYLALVFPAAVAKKLSARLRRAKVETQLAKDIVRAARITPLPATNAKVAHDLAKIAKGKPIPPILLVRGDATRDLPLIVADGMHRLSAAWHAQESAPVACCFADRPKR